MSPGPKSRASKPKPSGSVDLGQGFLEWRRCKLSLEDATGRATDYIFDQDAIHIGADPGNDLVIPDASVSRLHATVLRRVPERGEAEVAGDDEASWVIQDRSSRNGTSVDGVRITEAYLKAGAVLRVGVVELRFHPLQQRIAVVPSDRERYGDIVGASLAMRQIFGVLERISGTDATVLIEGKTGTGKEIVARTIHKMSPRADKPFVVVDCGAIPENLIESELFGHEKGSFTGAVGKRQGLVEQANGGTLFLDEIGELGRELQPKLLRVLERREVKRIGSNVNNNVDVRFVAATNRELREEVDNKRFREDLYFRLNVIRLTLPPLSERPEDIPLLVRNFLRVAQSSTRDASQLIRGATRQALDALMTYGWPGNVRELLNVIERARLFARGGFIDVADLPEHITGLSRRSPRVRDEETAQVQAQAGAGPLRNYHEARDEWVAVFERDYVRRLLVQHGFNISRAAKEAGVDRKHLRNLMKKHGLDVETLKRSMGTPTT
jgi:DNA-binding NtrC family response regulator